MDDNGIPVRGWLPASHGTPKEGADPSGVVLTLVRVAADVLYLEREISTLSGADIAKYVIGGTRSGARGRAHG
jgi:hypothetical protein